MEHSRRGKMALLGDLRRMIAPLDVLYAIGNLIYRRSLRYTLLTAGIAVVGLVAKSIGLPGFTVRQAIVLPLLIGGLSLVFGVLLKVLPNLIANRLLTVAQASDLNLMEDYRKSQADEHLNALWNRLFQHECRLRMASGRHGPLVHANGHTENEAFARAKANFFVRAGSHSGSGSPLSREWSPSGPQPTSRNSTASSTPTCSTRRCSSGPEPRTASGSKSIPAREQLLRCRRRSIRRIFGQDLAAAQCVLDHMLYCTFAAAT